MGKEKTRVFVGMSGGFGPLSQVLPIIETLERDRFDITCYIASSSANMVKELGYKFLESPCVAPPKKLIPKGYKWWNIDHYWGRFGYIDPEYINAMLPARIEQIRQYKPDVIISQFSPPTEIAARVLGIPLAAVTQSCMHPKGPGVSWWEKPPEDFLEATEVVNCVLKKYGAAPIERMEDLNKGDLTVIPSFPEFDPVNDDVHYIGPLRWESSGRKGGFNMDGLRTKSGPLIFVYTGNLFDSAGPSGFTILQNVIKAFGNTEYNVIVSTGLNQSLEGIGNVPSNIKITEWAPAAQLIQNCDLAIHHGGHGSCMLNIIHGVPAVIIPTFSEREFNARQYQKLGAGKFILLEELSAKRLFDDVSCILNTGKYRAKAQEWAETLKSRAYGGGADAKEHILELIKG